MFYILIHFKMSFILVVAKLNFKHQYLQCLASHGPFEIILCWFGAQET